MADDGFEAFFAEHFDSVRRSLAIALGDAGMAEEFAQEAFARALRRWRVVRHHDRPATWVYVVAVRAAGRRFSSDRPGELMVAQAGDGGIGAVTAAVTIRGALRTLGQRQRLCVVLRYLVDLPLAEVAEVMGCSVGTVKSTLHTALRHLRVELDDTDDEGERDVVHA